MSVVHHALSFQRECIFTEEKVFFQSVIYNFYLLILVCGVPVKICGFIIPASLVTVCPSPFITGKTLQNLRALCAIKEKVNLSAT